VGFSKEIFRLSPLHANITFALYLKPIYSKKIKVSWNMQLYRLVITDISKNYSASLFEAILKDAGSKVLQISRK
jgi:hypothetical protein